jgi:hypothetical protein
MSLGMKSRPYPWVLVFFLPADVQLLYKTQEKALRTAGYSGIILTISVSLDASTLLVLQKLHDVL